MDATRREDLAGLVGDIEGLETIFAGWEDTPRLAAEAYRRAIEALHGEALRRLVRALKLEPAALAALKGALSDEVVYAVLRRHGIVKPSLTERVEEALETVRPMLASHGGNVELVGLEPPVLEVRFTGACDGCSASQLTFHEGVKKAVEVACPEIAEIRQVRGHASSHAAPAANGSSGLVSPFALRGGRWQAAGRVDEIPDGGVCAVEVGGERLLLARRGAQITCFQNACAHLGLPLERGLVDDGVLTCPHHGFRYDLTSGECLTAPQVQLVPHAVRVVSGRVDIQVGA